MEKLDLTSAIALLESENNLSTIYTKQDVLNLLNRIETGPNNEFKISEYLNTFIRCLIGTYEHEINNMETEDLIDRDSATFELSGNEIYLDSISINDYNLEKKLEDIIETSIDSAKENFNDLLEEGSIG